MKKASLKKNQSTLLQTWGFPAKNNAQMDGGGGRSGGKAPKPKAIIQTNIKKEKDPCTEVLQDPNLDLDGFFDDDIDIDDDLDLINGGESFNAGQSFNGLEKDTFLDDDFDPNTYHENIKGFDVQFGSTYIYPTNYPVRDYQFSIIKSALLKNTLVVLPTGLGKTFIAAVVIYNFYRWYPQGKLIFMAPTKPLVAQQIEACYNIMGIPQSDTAEMTGAMNPQKRELLWNSKRVFFLTPQVLQNDIGRGTCFAPDVICLVFDEAHRALGNHAYCQVLREVVRYHLNFRVLALSATPGDDMGAVQHVIDNLLISHIEIRTEESPDIKKYSFERQLQKIVVPLSDEMKKVQAIQLQVMQQVVDRLYSKNALWQNNANHVSKFALLQAREQWRNNNASKNKASDSVIEGEFALAMSLFHAYEVLQQHGLLSFYNFLKGVLAGTKGSPRTRMELSRNPKFMQMMENLHMQIEPNEMSHSLNETIMEEKKADPKKRLLKSIPQPLRNFTSHPKLNKIEEIVLEHFKKFNQNGDQGGSCNENEDKKENSRVIIFSQYRDSVQEITAVLSKHEPIVKVMSFIGQGSKESSTSGKCNRGLSQKEQLEVIRKFRSGGYNTIVSTSVGEEGLDIGQVDLIICFDAPSSPIRLIQRMGRTGRKRAGRIIILVSAGREEAAYKKSLSSKKGIHKNLVNSATRFALYKESRRMIPQHMNPKCYKMSISVDQYQKQGKESRKSLSKSDAKPSTSRRNSCKTAVDSNFVQKSIQFKKSDAYLDESESEYLEMEFFGDSEGCHKCQYNQSINKYGKFCSHIDFKYPLSLTKWCPWQTRSQGVVSVSHSARTSTFCRLMGFIEKVKETSVVDKYENKMKRYLNEEDVLLTISNENVLNKRTSLPNKKLKKNDIGKAWRQNYVENFKNPLDSEDDDFASINVVKKDIELKKNTPRVEEEDEELKPCSLDKLLEKVDSGLKNKKKERVRLTKLPKLPIRELDIATIEDNQLNFCSQISMDTLYNRIRKKSDPLLRTMFDEINDNSTITEDATEEKVHNPVLDWIRNMQGEFNACSPNNNTELQGEEGSMLPPKSDSDVCEKIDDEDEDDFLFMKKNENANIPEELDKIDKDDGVGGLLPLSSPKKSKSSKPRNVCVVTPTMRDTVPEPPPDIDLNWFNFDETSKSSSKNENEIKHIVLVPPPDILEPPDVLVSPTDFPVPPDVPELPDDDDDHDDDDDDGGGDISFNFKSASKQEQEIEANTKNETESKNCVQTPPSDVPEHLSDDDDFIFKLVSNKNQKINTDSNYDASCLNHKEKVVRTSNDAEINKVTEENINEDNFTKKSDLELSFTMICEKSKWKKRDFGMLDDTIDEALNGVDNDIPTSPPMLSQYVSKFNAKSHIQLPKELSVENEATLNQVTKTSDVDDGFNKTSYKQGKNKKVENVIQSSQSEFKSDIVRKVGKKTSNKLQKFLFKKNECNESDQSNVHDEDSVTKEQKITDTRDNIEQSHMKNESHEASTPSQTVENVDELIEFSDDESPIIKKRNVAVTNENCIIYSPVTPTTTHKDNSVCKTYDEAVVDITEESTSNDFAIGKVVRKRSRTSNVKRRNQLKKKHMFIEYEAEDDCVEEPYESGDETHMNAYIKDSFIDDNTQLSPTFFTQQSSTIQKRKDKSFVDMNLIYKQSLMSPSNCPLTFQTPAFRAGKNCFKMVNLEENYKNHKLDESSEAEEVMGLVKSDEEFVSSEPEDSKYKQSPFDKIKYKNEKDKYKGISSLGKKKLFRTSVIENDETFENNEDDIEDVSGFDESCLQRKKKPLKRVRTLIDSDDDDNEEFVKHVDSSETNETQLIKKPWCKTFTVWELPEITFSFGINWNDGDKSSDPQQSKPEKHDNSEKRKEISVGKADMIGKQGLSTKVPLVIIDSRCVSNNKIASSLRLKENCKVLVHEKIGCDYVISKRSGLLRKYLSDVTNGVNFLKLNENFQSLCELYSKTFVIIEKDRVKVNSSKKPSYFSKFYAGLLSKLVAANITILFSEDQDETASLIGKLVRSEEEKGFAITDTPKKAHEQQMLKSLLLVPKMNYPVAVELISKCKCLRQLVKSSLEGMKKILHFVPPQQVSEYYFFFQRRFDLTQIGSDKIK